MRESQGLIAAQTLLAFAPAAVLNPVLKHFGQAVDVRALICGVLGGVLCFAVRVVMDRDAARRERAVPAVYALATMSIVLASNIMG